MCSKGVADGDAVARKMMHWLLLVVCVAQRNLRCSYQRSASTVPGTVVQPRGTSLLTPQIHCALLLTAAVAPYCPRTVSLSTPLLWYIFLQLCVA